MCTLCTCLRTDDRTRTCTALDLNQFPLPIGVHRRTNGRIRTCDIHFRRVTFYPLNYVGMFPTAHWDV